MAATHHIRDAHPDVIRALQELNLSGKPLPSLEVCSSSSPAPSILTRATRRACTLPSSVPWRPAAAPSRRLGFSICLHRRD
ncbi:hypothetical protein EXIGLDRAFT_723061 [Exidia glandulosa HHB12029]|uniref:Uncharacterized protein n=1 Tax=Exidia glandulosa HHB12029 TaxID=1314781 RepID=A0A165EZD6_EXIGL|nr:hypothetical protein EXIGLDRAFT_723061 [Exidia glandulosa HHB12029]